MNEAITLSSLAQFLGLLVLLGGLWYRVETRISAGAMRAQEKADLVAVQLGLYREMSNDLLNKFKLEVAETYARTGYLKDVEARLISRFDAIVEELHGIRADFHEAMMRLAEGNATSPTSRSTRKKT